MAPEPLADRLSIELDSLGILGVEEREGVDASDLDGRDRGDSQTSQVDIEW